MIIGHQKQKDYFKRIINNGRLSHAYIFSGPDKIGKKQFALELFREINGRDADGDPDIRVLKPKIDEGETKIYISDVRETKSFLSYKPYFGPYKAVVIDQAECLTNDAANAILKLLEEPPSSSILFLITSNPKMLPDTVRSRCEDIKFQSLSEKELVKFLSERNLTEEDSGLIIAISRGRIGWIVDALKDDNFKEIKKSIKEFQRILKLGVFEKIEYVKKLTDRDDYTDVVDNIIAWIYSGGINKPKAVRELLNLRNILSQPQFNHRLAVENFLINL